MILPPPPCIERPHMEDKCRGTCGGGPLLSEQVERDGFPHFLSKDGTFSASSPKGQDGYGGTYQTSEPIDEIFSYIQAVPEYGESLIAKAYRSSTFAQRTWSSLVGRIESPNVAWGPLGNILFWWEVDDLHVELEFNGTEIEFLMWTDGSEDFAELDVDGAVSRVGALIQYPSKAE